MRTAREHMDVHPGITLVVQVFRTDGSPTLPEVEQRHYYQLQRGKLIVRRLNPAGRMISSLEPEAGDWVALEAAWAKSWRAGARYRGNRELAETFALATAEAPLAYMLGFDAQPGTCRTRSRREVF